MRILEKVKDFMGLTGDDDGYGYDGEDDDDAYDRQYPQPEPVVASSAAEEERRSLRNRVNGEARSASKINNVVGMPGIMNGVSEMILIEPRSFEEMPQVIDALRSRKSVILNMTLIRQEEAQRSVDFVAGGTYAIDGHYERIGDNIFLFTPNCVQVSSPNNVVNESVDKQTPARNSRANQSNPTWNNEPMQGLG